MGTIYVCMSVEWRRSAGIIIEIEDEPFFSYLSVFRLLLENYI